MSSVVPLRTAEEFLALAAPAVPTAKQAHLQLRWLGNGRQNNRLGVRVRVVLGRRLRAVQRNRLRRQVRELYRRTQHDVPQGYDVLLITTCSNPPVFFAQLMNEWSALCAHWRTAVAKSA